MHSGSKRLHGSGTHKAPWGTSPGQHFSFNSVKARGSCSGRGVSAPRRNSRSRAQQFRPLAYPGGYRRGIRRASARSIGRAHRGNLRKGGKDNRPRGGFPLSAKAPTGTGTGIIRAPIFSKTPSTESPNCTRNGYRRQNWWQTPDAIPPPRSFHSRRFLKTAWWRRRES